MKKTQEGRKPQEVRTKKETIEETKEEKHSLDVVTEETEEKLAKEQGLAEPGKPTLVEKPEPRDKYFIVQWAQRIGTTEKERVEITVNGETLTWKRSVKTAAPLRYLEAADHTEHEEYEQDMNKPPDQEEGYRKTIKLVSRFPYSRYEEISEQEYLELKSVGDKEIEKYLEDRGMTRE